MQLMYYLLYWPTLLLLVDGLSRLREKRLAGSHKWSIQMAPYMVSFECQGRTLCGASIISRDMIITAGHCTMHNNFPSSVEIRAGSTYRGSQGSLHHVMSFARHENFTLDLTYERGIMFMNDIALVKVSPSFVFGVRYQPVRLANIGDLVKSKWDGIVNGWGRVPEEQKEDPNHNRLQIVTVSILDKSACRISFSRILNYTLKPGQFCSETNGKSPCPGDAGGPLVVNGRQAGIVSSRTECNTEDTTPSVYTEIAYFRHWINEKVSELSEYSWGDRISDPYSGFKRIVVAYH